MTKELGIREVRTSVLRVPRPKSISSAIGTYTATDLIVVDILTEDGVLGHGYSVGIAGGSLAMKSFIDTEFVPLLLGQDPYLVKDLWWKLFHFSLSRGRKGVAMYALSAVDIALWDIVAKRANLPLYKVLGGYRERIPAYGDGCWMSLSLEELLSEAHGYVAKQCWGVKVKIGHPDPEVDMMRLRRVKEVLPKGTKLLVDANQAYDPLTAIRVSRMLEELDPYWFEEPVIADSVHDQARVAAASRVPIAVGENEYSRFGFRELLEHGAAHILQPDVHRVGGITEFMRIAALAEAWNIKIAPHTSHEVHVQLMAALPNGLVLEYYPWFPPDLFLHPFVMEEGHFRVPQRPGVGVEFNPELAAALQIA